MKHIKLIKNLSTRIIQNSICNHKFFERISGKELVDHVEQNRFPVLLGLRKRLLVKSLPVLVYVVVCKIV